MPAAVLPSRAALPAPDTAEPSVPCAIVIDGPRIASVARFLAPGAPVSGAADLGGAVVSPSRSFSEFLSRPGPGRRLVDGGGIRDALPPQYRELGQQGPRPAQGHRFPL